jgi:HlyD family secretion protein
VSSTPRAWQRRGLWLLSAVVILAIGAAGLAWWWTHRDMLRYVTAKVTAGDIRRSVSMTGALNPVVTAQVSSYVSGNIKAWYCDYNTMVKIGQRCALIDPLPFQVVVDEDAADERTSEAQLVKDRAALVAAEVIYKRDLQLLDQGIVSQQQVDSDKSTFEQDKAQIDLDIASIAEKKATLRAADVNLAYTNIVSPVEGMVITRYIDIGQTVVSSTTASTLFLIGKDMSKMQVDTNVSEADVGEVKAGQKAYFEVQAYPKRTFRATVRQVREGPITVQNVVTYDVVLDVDNKDFALFPGMTADAHIITAERTNVLRVPLPATRFVPEGLARGTRGARGGGEAAPEAREGSGHEGAGGTERHGGHGEGAPPGRIWLLVNGKPLLLRVRAGLDDGTLIEVSGAGLKAGDDVVVNAVRPDSARGAAAGNDGSRPGTTPAARGGGFQGGGPRF